MAKSIAQKLVNSKSYYAEFGDRALSEIEQFELTEFDKNIGFNYDRIGTLVKFIKQGYTDWGTKWEKVKSLRSGDLEMQVLLYGEAEGNRRYTTMNARKTAKMDHSHAAQLARGLKAGEKLRGSKSHSVRGIGFWVKKGLTEDEAKEKVRHIQATNNVARYITKHGEEAGLEKFNSRNAEWRELMSDPKIGKKRSLGLWRYIERYGEVEGKIEYMMMRKTRNENSSIGKASTESITAFSDVIRLLDNTHIKYYFGVDDNKEWFIYDSKLERPFFYDLTIPSISLIIEYHGEAFHPNPNWDTDTWNSWKALFSNKPADEVYAVDQYKKKLAENTGWRVIEVYSSDHSPLSEARSIIEGRG